MSDINVHISVTINDAAIVRLVSWQSEFGRSFKKLAKMITISAKGNVPHEYSNVGTLRRSIDNTAGRGQKAKGIFFDVSAKTKYALFVESGTSPHTIRPKNPNGYLVFFWRRTGRTMFMKGVRHPGNRAYRYLENGMIKSVGVWTRTG